jgi:hypothetical protein
MQLLVATWTIRVAIIAALAVGGSSSMAAAVLFTFAGRWLMGWLEPPERRLLRMRQKREARRAKSLKAAKAGLAAKSEASGAGGRRKPKSATSAQKA